MAPEDLWLLWPQLLPSDLVLLGGLPDLLLRVAPEDLPDLLDLPDPVGRVGLAGLEVLGSLAYPNSMDHIRNYPFYYVDLNSMNYSFVPL
ncbi:hypothetical protein GCM10023142_23150 [Anaerocolumna aminovalerica]